VDVPELLRILNFDGCDIRLLTPEASAANEMIYPSPAAEFVLSVITLKTGSVYQSPAQRSVEIIICTHGNVTTVEHDTQTETKLGQGASVIIPASVTRYTLKGEGTCYKASVPISVERDRSTDG
jgi:mannose-6-phosphate isomerase